MELMSQQKELSKETFLDLLKSKRQNDFTLKIIEKRFL